MFSLATAGILRVGALVLAGGAIAGGFYLYAETRSEGNGADPQVQVVLTATATSDTPIAATPTAASSPPEPTATASSIDTSQWETYTSPLGLAIRYPPSWLVVVDQQAPGGAGAKILNEARQAQTAPEGGGSGEAWIEINPRTPGTDLDQVVQSCLQESDPAITVQSGQLALGGMMASRCFKEGPSVYDPTQRGTADSYYIGMPSGQVVSITLYAIQADAEIIALLETSLFTLAVDPAR